MSDGDFVKDLTISTLNNLGRGSWNQIAQKLVQYPIVDKIFKRKRVKKQGGKGIQKQLMLKQSDTARSTTIYNPDDVKVHDIMTTLTMDWKYYDNSTGFDMRVLEQNRNDPEALYDLIKSRDYDMKLGLFEKLENDFSQPYADRDSNDMHGLTYWVVKNTSTDGFTGGAPTGETLVGNINPDEYTNWKNYSYRYTSSLDADDLLPKLEEGLIKTGFITPVPVNDYNTGTGKMIMSGYETIKNMKKVIRSQNSNLGFDLDPIGGNIRIQGIPWIYNPILDNDSNEPVYCLDMDYWEFVSLSGYYFKSSKLRESKYSHNVYEKFVDVAINSICTDRRRQSVFFKNN